MDDRDQLREDRLEAVQTFGRANRGDFAAGSVALDHFANVDRILGDLADAKVGQVRLPVTKETQLQALRLDLKNIARTARAVALKDPTFPGAAYALPQNPAERALLDHAKVVLNTFEPHPEDDDATVVASKAALVAQFVAYELPADFVADLRADYDAVPKANEDKRADNQEGVENTAAIERLLREGNAEVQHLDAIMHNKYTRDVDKLRAWRTASHVQRAPARRATAVGTAPKTIAQVLREGAAGASK